MWEAVEAAGAGRAVEARRAGARGGRAGAMRARYVEAAGAMAGRAVEAAGAGARNGGGRSRGARWRVAEQGSPEEERRRRVERRRTRAWT